MPEETEPFTGSSADAQAAESDPALSTDVTDSGRRTTKNNAGRGGRPQRDPSGPTTHLTMRVSPRGRAALDQLQQMAKGSGKGVVSMGAVVESLAIHYLEMEPDATSSALPRPVPLKRDDPVYRERGDVTCTHVQGGVKRYATGLWVCACGATSLNRGRTWAMPTDGEPGSVGSYGRTQRGIEELKGEAIPSR